MPSSTSMQGSQATTLNPLGCTRWEVFSVLVLVQGKGALKSTAIASNKEEYSFQLAGQCYRMGAGKIVIRKVCSFLSIRARISWSSRRCGGGCVVVVVAAVVGTMPGSLCQHHRKPTTRRINEGIDQLAPSSSSIFTRAAPPLDLRRQSSQAELV